MFRLIAKRRKGEEISCPRESWQHVYMSRVDSLIKSQLRSFYCLLSFTLWPLNYSLHWGRLSQKNDNGDDEFLSFFFRCPHAESEKCLVSETRVFSSESQFGSSPERQKEKNNFQCAIPGKNCANKTSAVFHLFDETSPLFLFIRQSPRYAFREICLAENSDAVRVIPRQSICKRESY